MKPDPLLKAKIEESIDLTLKLKCVIDAIMQNIGTKGDELVIKKIRMKVRKIEKNLENNLKELPEKEQLLKNLARKDIKGLYKRFVLSEQHKTKFFFDKILRVELVKLSILPIKIGRLDNSFQCLQDFKDKVKNKEVPGLLMVKVESLEYKNHYKVEARFDLDMKIKMSCFKGLMKNIKISYEGESQVNLQLLCTIFQRFCKIEFKLLSKHPTRCLERAASWLNSRKSIFSSLCQTCNCLLNFTSGQPQLPLLKENQNHYHISCYFDKATVPHSSSLSNKSKSIQLQSQFNLNPNPFMQIQ